MKRFAPVDRDAPLPRHASDRLWRRGDTSSTASADSSGAASGDASGSTGGSTKDTLVYACTTEPGKLDPQANGIIHGMMIEKQLYDPLITRDPETGEFVGRLATEWEWIDDTHLSLTLREGVKWHDGSDFHRRGRSLHPQPFPDRRVDRLALHRVRSGEQHLGRRLPGDHRLQESVRPGAQLPDPTPVRSSSRRPTVKPTVRKHWSGSRWAPEPMSSRNGWSAAAFR